MRLLYAVIRYDGSYTAFLKSFYQTLKAVQPIDVLRFILESCGIGPEILLKSISWTNAVKMSAVGSVSNIVLHADEHLMKSL